MASFVIHNRFVEDLSVKTHEFWIDLAAVEYVSLNKEKMSAMLGTLATEDDGWSLGGITPEQWKELVEAWRAARGE